MITLADAKRFCRVDHDDDDTVVKAALAAASDHLKSISVDIEGTPAGMIDRLCRAYREVHL